MTSRRRGAGSAAPDGGVRRRPGVATSLGSLAASATGSWALLSLARRLPPATVAPWERTNHAGRSVTLLEGPAWVGGAVVGALAGTVLGGGTAGSTGPTAGRTAGSAAVVALAAGALGALDDLSGGVDDKGLKGHLRALARGQVTTGAVKVVGLAATGLVGAALVDARRPARASALATLLGGAVVAGAANAVNLFDLRPGRALKVTALAGLPLLGSLPAAAAVGSSAGVVRDDLAARSMLGDTGANAAGALVGLAVVESTGLRGRVVAFVALTALTLASERVSFTRVIAGNPVLRRLDEWGRGSR